MAAGNIKVICDFFLSQPSKNRLLGLADLLAMFLQGLEEMTGHLFFFEILNELLWN